MVLIRNRRQQFGKHEFFSNSSDLRSCQIVPKMGHFCWICVRSEVVLKQKSYRPTPRFLLHCATKAFHPAQLRYSTRENVQLRFSYWNQD